ncbi:MAG TPA: hypothetical protein VL625_01705 [Patescibacteria group bacterium]|nr:hypothetical protein [Patescibacteria group bacterium]
MSSQNHAGPGGRLYAQAICPASDVALTLTLPKRATPSCKDAFKEMRYACHLGEATCDDCEKATAAFDDACNVNTDVNNDYDCESDGDCALVDIDCNSAYDPTSLNRFRVIAARRRNGWPIAACLRSRSDMKKFHAVCSEHRCDVESDG